jgi:hypothetical protein
MLLIVGGRGAPKKNEKKQKKGECMKKNTHERLLWERLSVIR